MSGLESRYRTLGELMTEIRSRLGFVVQGPAAKTNDLVIKSFLQEAHDYVYGELEPSSMRKKTAIKVKKGSYIYDFNNDAEDEPIDPGMVMSVWVILSPLNRTQLQQGISERDRALSSVGNPTKYDNINGQIELYPIPGDDCDLLIEYTAEKNRFDRASDRPSVPDRLVFLYALATSKAHYRHPDAQASAQTFQNMLNKEKFRQKENKRYFMGSTKPRELQVVSTANGYTLG